eukprot:4387806-Pyramimonas_sp.AAC.1
MRLKPGARQRGSRGGLEFRCGLKPGAYYMRVICAWYALQRRVFITNGYTNSCLKGLWGVECILAIIGTGGP